MATISEQIEAIASDGVQSVSSDAGSFTATPIPDLIAADKHLSAKEATQGTNENGGPVSLWSKLSPAVPRFMRPD